MKNTTPTLTQRSTIIRNSADAGDFISFMFIGRVDQRDVLVSTQEIVLEDL